MKTQLSYFVWSILIFVLWTIDIFCFETSVIGLFSVIICQNFSRYLEEWGKEAEK